MLCMPKVEGRSCEGQRVRTRKLHSFTRGKGGRQGFGNHDLERWRECSEVTGVDVRSVENHFKLMIQSSDASKVREREGFSLFSPVKVFCAVLCAVWTRKYRSSSEESLMGGDPVTTEPSVLKVDEEVRGILEGADLLDFTIYESLIAKVSGLSREGEIITKEKTNQVGQLTKFIKGDETLCWLDSGIARESLPKPWDRVAVQIMKEGEGPLHQGLMKLLFDHEKEKKSVAAGPTRGGFSTLSGTPVSKAQLLLGHGPVSPTPKSSETISDSEEDLVSQGDDTPLARSKEGGGRKRKPPPQTLNANLAKCNQRSTRLQKKTVDKAKIMDFVDSSEEDHTVSDVGKNTEGGCSFKVVGVAPSDKGPAKGPDGT
eukprot:Gb_28058 [translate_table: standard]